jgi:hypothetical protein
MQSNPSPPFGMVCCRPQVLVREMPGFPRCVTLAEIVSDSRILGR